MKTDVKAEIRAGLVANAELVALVGRDPENSEKIYPIASPYADAYPRITFFEIDNPDILYADDVPTASEAFVQIDIWSKGSTSAIAGEVDNTMKSLGWARTSAADLSEMEGTAIIYHKAMRYRAQFGEE